MGQDESPSPARVPLGACGQVIALAALDLVAVTTADPFCLEHDDTSWRHEKAQLRLVSEFNASLP